MADIAIVGNNNIIENCYIDGRINFFNDAAFNKVQGNYANELNMNQQPNNNVIIGNIINNFAHNILSTGHGNIITGNQFTESEKFSSAFDMMYGNYWMNSVDGEPITDAEKIAFTAGETGLNATDVQAAIAELAGSGSGGNYLPLSGGTMQGDVNFSAGEDPSMSRGVKFTVNMESAHLHGLNEGSGTMLEASDQMGELVRLRFADPVASTDGATKGYVDGKSPLIVTVSKTETGEWTADHTAYEIYQAYLSGIFVYAVTNETDASVAQGMYLMEYAACLDEENGTYSTRFWNVRGTSVRYFINIGGTKTENGIVRPLKSTTAATAITFEPGETGLTSTNVQDAIEELAGSGGGSSGAQIWRSEYAGTGTSTVETNGFGTGHIPDEVFIFPVDSSGADYFRAVLRRDGASRSYNFNGTCSSLYIMSFGANAISWGGPGGDGSMNASGVTYEMIGIKYSEIIN